MSDYNPQDPAGPGAPMRWTSSSTHVPSPNVQATMHQMTEQLQTVIDAAERAAEAIRYDAEEQARRHLAEAQRKADRMTAERVGLISELTDDLVRHAANVRDHSEQMVRALEDAITSVTDKLEQPAMTDPFPNSEPPGPSLPFGEAIEAPPPGAGAIVDSGGYTDLVGVTAYGGSESSPTPVPPSPQPAEPPPPAPAQPEPSSQIYEEPVVSEEIIEEPPPLPPVPAPPPVAPPPQTPEAGTPVPAEPPAVEQDPVPIEPQPEVSQEALLHATRLAIAGEDRDAIANALRHQFGIADPEPIVNRVLGGSA